MIQIQALILLAVTCQKGVPKKFTRRLVLTLMMLPNILMLLSFTIALVQMNFVHMKLLVYAQLVRLERLSIEMILHMEVRL